MRLVHGFVRLCAATRLRDKALLIASIICLLRERSFEAFANFYPTSLPIFRFYRQYPSFGTEVFGEPPNDIDILEDLGEAAYGEWLWTPLVLMWCKEDRGPAPKREQRSAIWPSKGRLAEFELATMTIGKLDTGSQALLYDK
jgi:hypothetical protein